MDKIKERLKISRKKRMQVLFVIILLAFGLHFVSSARDDRNAADMAFKKINVQKTAADSSVYNCDTTFQNVGYKGAKYRVLFSCKLVEDKAGGYLIEKADKLTVESKKGAWDFFTLRDRVIDESIEVSKDKKSIVIFTKHEFTARRFLGSAIDVHRFSNRKIIPVESLLTN